MRRHPERGQLDGVEDLRVPGAAAEVARERLLDLLPRRRRPLGQERLSGEEDARRAVAALRRAELGERLLERMEAAVARHPLDRGDLAPGELRGQGQAREHGLAVHEDRAGPALAELAPVLGAGEPEVLTEDLEQGLVDGDEDLVGLAVDRQREPSFHPHSCPGGD